MRSSALIPNSTALYSPRRRLLQFAQPAACIFLSIYNCDIPKVSQKVVVSSPAFLLIITTFRVVASVPLRPLEACNNNINNAANCMHEANLTYDP